MTSAKDSDSLETPERTCFGIPLSALAVCIALSLTVGLIGMVSTWSFLVAEPTEWV